MKINHPVGQTAQVLPSFASAKISKTEGSKPVSASTQIQASNQLQALAAQRSNSSFDSQKVQAIKTAIAEGRFEVNLDKVADGLINTAADLIRSRTRTA